MQKKKKGHSQERRCVVKSVACIHGSVHAQSQTQRLLQQASGAGLWQKSTGVEAKANQNQKWPRLNHRLWYGKTTGGRTGCYLFQMVRPMFF